MLKDIKGKRAAVLVLAFGSSVMIPAAPSHAIGTCEDRAAQACFTYFPQGYFTPYYSSLEECEAGETAFRCVGSGGGSSGGSWWICQNNQAYYDPYGTPALGGTNCHSVS